MRGYWNARIYLYSCLLPFLLLALTGGTVNAGTDMVAWERFATAKSYRDQGEWKSAEIELKNIVQQSPADFEPRLLLSQVYLQLNKGASAEKELRRALELGADRQALLLPLGEALLMQGISGDLLAEIVPEDDFSDRLNGEIAALRADAYLSEKLLEQASAAAQQAQDYWPQLNRTLLIQGRLALIENNLAAARHAVEQLLADDPENAKAWSLSGDIFNQTGDWEKAEIAYSQVIQNRQGQAHSLVQLKRALVRIEQQDYTGAAADIEALQQVFLDHPDVNYAEGLLAFRQQDSAAAQSAFNRVIQQQPDNLLARYYLGAACYLQKDLAQAEVHLSRYLAAQPAAVSARILLARTRLQAGDFNGAEILLRPLQASSPDDPLVLKTLGNALLAQHKTAEGNALLARAVRLQPNDADERTELALGLLRAGDRKAGMQQLEAATHLDRNNYKADILLIREYLQSGKHAMAVTTAQRLAVNWPASPAPHTLMGMGYAGQGALELAQRSFEQALKLEPGDPSAATNLAVLAAKTGDANRARDYYQQVLNHHPSHLQTQLNLARLESELGRESESRAWIEAAIQTNPQALAPRLLLARVKFKAGRALSALVTLQPVAEKYAYSPLLLALLGEIQISAQQPANAVHTLEKLVRLQPHSAYAHYLLASAYIKNNDTNRLQDALIKALTLQPDHPLARDITAAFIALATNPDEGQARIQALKEVVPDHPEVIGLEGQLALLQQAPEKAVPIFAGLHKRFPTENRWVILLSRAHKEAGDTTAQINSLTDWLQRYPNDVAVTFTLANSYLDAHQPDQAAAAFSRVVEQAPSNVVALNNLAWLLRETAPEQALVYAQRAQALSPDDALVMDTVKVIQEQISHNR